MEGRAARFLVDPIALPFERVGRQGDTAAPEAALKAESSQYRRQPQTTDQAQLRDAARRRLDPAGSGRLATSVRPGRAGCARASPGQSLPGAHFEQDAIRVLQQRSDSIAETDGAAEVGGPIGGICRLCSLDPAAVQIGDPRNDRLVARDSRGAALRTARGIGSIMAEWKACEVCNREP